MNYFKDSNGAVYAYDAEQVAAGLADSKTPMTAGEVAAHLNPAPEPLTREQIEAIRLREYADPLTGSDRHFSKAMRLDAMGDPEKAEASRVIGITRYQEIQEQYPWP